MVQWYTPLPPLGGGGGKKDANLIVVQGRRLILIPFLQHTSFYE